MKKIFLFILSLSIVFGCNGTSEETDFLNFRSDYSERSIISIELIEQYNNTNMLIEITNNSDEVISIFRPNIPDRFLAKDLFDVEIDSFKSKYIGRLVSFRDIPENWHKFLPNSSQLFSVDLSDGYDFPEEGYYTVKYNSYVALKRETREVEIHYLSSPGVTININEPVFYKFAATPACNSSQKNTANKGIVHARGKTQNTINYLAQKGMDSYYVKWFGAKNNTRFNTIKTGYNKIRTAINRNITHLCASTCDGWIAFVYKQRPYEINWCAAYINKGNIASIGETSIHETSHWNIAMSTDDYVYGKSGAMNLAKSDPGKAIDNADNICFYPYDIPNATEEPPIGDAIVSLFEHINYAGYRVDIVSVNSYNMNKLISMGFKNDDISSIKVKTGYEAIIYKNIDFQGTSHVIKSDINDLRKLNFNDAMTSLVVRRAGTEPESSNQDDSLQVNEIMRPGDFLVSANKNYKFYFQGDSNLVLYALPHNAIWASGTNGKNGKKLILQKDGNLVLYNANGRALWASGTNGKNGKKFQVLNSGNLVIWNNNGNVIWSVPDDVSEPPETEPPSGDTWYFVVSGDTRTSDGAHRSVLKAVKNYTPQYELYLNSGDVVNDGTNRNDWNIFIKAVGDILGSGWQTKYLACPGNHDKVYSGTGLSNWNNYLPGQKNYGDKGRYFKYRHRNALFLVLDADGNKDSQATFIKNATNNSGATWIFAVWHYPNYYSQWINALNNAKFDGIFFGHEHHYNRSEKGSYFGIIVGTGGAPLSSKSISAYGYLECKINSNKMTVKFIKANGGQVLDQKTYVANSR